MPPVISEPTSQTELSQVLNKDKVDEYAPSSVITVIIGLMLFVMAFLSQNMKFWLVRMRVFHGIVSLVLLKIAQLFFPLDMNLILNYLIFMTLIFLHC